MTPRRHGDDENPAAGHPIPMARTVERMATEDCQANIGPRERARRLRFGLVALGVSVAAAALLVGLGLGRPLRGLLVLPLFIAGTGIFQAREKT